MQGVGGSNTLNSDLSSSCLNPNYRISSLQPLQNGHHHQISSDTGHQINQLDPSSSPHDDFLEQMLSTIPNSYSWPPPPSEQLPQLAVTADDDHHHQFHNHYDDSTLSLLALELRRNQIDGASAAATPTLQQELLLSSGEIAGGGGDSGLLLDRSRNDVVDAFSFKSPNPGVESSMQALYNGFAAESLHGTIAHTTPNQAQHFHHPQVQNFGTPATVMNQTATNGTAAQLKQRVRARRGQATDPHSIAERLRRERITERMKALQELVPNANKTDKASMLDEIIDYVKFIQLQVKVLSMSRLGGIATAAAPLVADLSSKGRGGDYIQAGPVVNNGTAMQRSSNGVGEHGAATSNGCCDSLKATEQKVAKLMEEDMGSAMQYLQGKGLCLMPISLATAISTATRNNHQPHLSPNANANAVVDGPLSPTVSILTVQSATTGNNGTGTAVSKP